MPIGHLWRLGQGQPDDTQMSCSGAAHIWSAERAINLFHWYHETRRAQSNGITRLLFLTASNWRVCIPFICTGSCGIKPCPVTVDRHIHSERFQRQYSRNSRGIFTKSERGNVSTHHTIFCDRKIPKSQNPPKKQRNEERRKKGISARRGNGGLVLTPIQPIKGQNGGTPRTMGMDGENHQEMERSVNGATLFLPRRRQFPNEGCPWNYVRRRTCGEMGSGSEFDSCYHEHER